MDVIIGWLDRSIGSIGSTCISSHAAFHPLVVAAVDPSAADTRLAGLLQAYGYLMAAWCVTRTTLSSAETPEPIRMPFGGRLVRLPDGGRQLCGRRAGPLLRLPRKQYRVPTACPLFFDRHN